ncbi:MAG: hypothetical protein K0S33_4296 [Bacteroidetes bacterium]|jgi:hypothetical protein|nr:hypothetical protein [Bacteroidota bacterium]
MFSILQKCSLSGRKFPLAPKKYSECYKKKLIVEEEISINLRENVQYTTKNVHCPAGNFHWLRKNVQNVIKKRVYSINCVS